MKIPCMLVFVLLASVTAEGRDCPATENSVVRFSLTSRRNKTGRWQTQVSFFPPADGTNEEIWSLHMEQRTVTTCQGQTQLEIHATLNSEPNASAPARHIPAGYELFPGVGYYKVHLESVIWARARQVCAEEGGHLVIVNSEPEANVVKQFFDRYPKEKLPNHDAYDSMWIGVYEQGAHGQYFTIFGETLNSTGFLRWHPGRPAEQSANECVILYRPTVGLYDLSCNRQAAFVCELP